MTPPPIRAQPKTRWVLFILLVLAVALSPFLLLGIGVASCLRISSDTRALRHDVFQVSGGNWDKTVELRAGPVLLGLARLGLSQTDLPPEARTALRSVRGAEVGVYRLHDGTKRPEPSALLLAGDKAMLARGWNRAVGVVRDSEVVAVYVPAEIASEHDIRVCVLVMNREDLVLVSARADLAPLMDLIHNQPEWRQSFGERGPFALRN